MRIAVFASAFHPSLGGVEEVCRQLTHDFIAGGHPTIIVTNRWPRDLPAHEIFEGIPVYRFATRVPTGHWKANLNFAVTHRHIRASINRLLREQHIDVLHAQCVSSTTLYALYAKRKLGLPLVVSLHGELTMDAAGIFQRPGIAAKIMHEALDEADAITACSASTLEEARRYHANFNKPATAIHNGIHLAHFENVAPHRHPKPYVLAMGRHVKQKGFDILLRAWAKVRNLDCDLILAGEGPESADLRLLSRSLGIADRVVFFGRASRQSAIALFKGCQFFVLPSRLEPFGLVNLEAMAAGKAVIATRVGGVAELVQDGITGVLIEPESEVAMSDAINALFASSELVSRLGAAARQRAAKFDWKTLALDYLNVLSRAAHAPSENALNPPVAATLRGSRA